MKKERKQVREAGRVEAGEILPEYDFSHARPNKYASRFSRIDPETPVPSDGVSPERQFRSTLNK